MSGFVSAPGHFLVWLAANAFDDRFTPGGSSCGSAVAVAEGLCTFALGTDTAGSGALRLVYA